MKTKNLIPLFLLLTGSIFAQIEINSYGSVGIGAAYPNDDYNKLKASGPSSFQLK